MIAILYTIKNFQKIKIIYHGDEVANFYDKEIPRADFNHTCLSVISLDSALKRDGNCYPKVLSKECERVGKKVVRHIHDSLSDFSYSSGESDEE